MKKILLISSEYPPLTGGIATHTWQLAGFLASDHYEVSVVTFGRETVPAKNHEVILIKPAFIYPLTFIKRVFLTLKISIRLKPDVIMVSNKFPIWLGWILSFLFPQVRFIAVLHGNELLQPVGWLNQFTRYCLHRFQKLIAVSAYTKSLLGHASSGERCIVIPNAITDDWLKHAMAPKEFSGKLRLLTVGTVRKRKGHAYVIQALPTLKKLYPELSYIICGLQQFPEYVNELKQLAEELRVEAHIRFVHVAFENLAVLQGLYREADICCLLSETQPDGDTEGFGISILEANSMGTPAIGAKGCGIEQALCDGVNGYLVSPGDTDLVVQSVLKTVKTYKTLSGQSMEWAKKHSWQLSGSMYREGIER